MEKEQIDKEIKFIDGINHKIWNLRGSPEADFDAMTIGREAYEKAKQINYSFGQAQCLLNLGMGSFIIKNDHALALEYMNESLEIFKELDNKKWIANALVTIALITNTIGKTQEALSNALRGINYFEDNKLDMHDSIMAYYVLGTIYKDLKRYSDSEKNYKIGINNTDKITVNTWSGRLYIGLAAVYVDIEKYDLAIEMNLKGLEILRSGGNVIGESRALNDLGIIYKKQKKYDEALKYFSESLVIREKHEIKRFVVSSYIEIALLYSEIGNAEKAIDYLIGAENAALTINFQAKLEQIYKEIAAIYKAQNNFELTVFYYEKLMYIRTALHQVDIETKINNLTEELVKEKEAEIEKIKNIELKAAYDIIELKNKEILDSINYAKRIQYVLLANKELLNNNLPEHFVLFKPKDIVSGDFYWATKKDDNFYLAVCDSTGHGVPGAFMSLLNMSFLNEAINEKDVLQPNEVLNHVRSQLISHMDGGRDGMDAILICFNKKTDTLTYSAANNMPLIVRDNKIIELPFDKMPVGKGETTNDFKNYTFDLKKGDNLFLYTDGYADQFGGPSGKKFKYRSLNEMLLTNAKEIADKQSQLLDKTFLAWKGELEQVDDVCIIGIKI